MLLQLRMTVLSLLLAGTFLPARAQQPRYTPKRLVEERDSAVINAGFKDDTSLRSCFVTGATLFDVDDDHTTPIMINARCLLSITGPSGPKKEGRYTAYVFDRDSSRKYRIWEQEYRDDKLNGTWKMYNLAGSQVSEQRFVNDSLDGMSRDYWLDGKTVIAETVYKGGSRHYRRKEFYPTGVLQRETVVRNGKLNGTARQYYDNGKPREVAGFRDDEFDGVRQYYHPNGQLWQEQVFRKGKYWKAVANYTADGKKRDAGTLRNGNGTIIYYNEDGTVRDVRNIVNGVPEE